MAFERPTLARLIKRARADIMTRLPGADANLSGSPEDVLAVTAAGMTHGLHGHLKWLSKQLLADLADDEFLIRIASIYGIDRTPAVAATGTVTITGTNTTICPAGTVWAKTDGTRYTQDANATISSGTATIDVTAEVSGSAGNAVAGTLLNIASPVTGINASATVSGGGITGGVDVETIEALRIRVLERLRTTPRGGGTGDYVNWAKEVSGVTRAWEYPLMNGLGTVGVRFVMDGQSPIIPDSGQVAAVQAHIDVVKPLTADVEVLAPVAVDLDFTIALTPDTTDVRDAVEASLQDYLTRTAEPGTTILISQLNEAISIATGETDHTMTVPAADVTHATGEIAVFGTITWV